MSSLSKVQKSVTKQQVQKETEAEMIKMYDHHQAELNEFGAQQRYTGQHEDIIVTMNGNEDLISITGIPMILADKIISAFTIAKEQCCEHMKVSAIRQKVTGSFE